MERSEKAAPGPRPSCSGLRLVHRGPRHARSEGGQEPARDARSMSTQTTMWHIRSWALLGPEPMPWHVRSWRKQTFEKQILGTPRPDQNSHARYTQREPEISLNYECNHQQPYATQRTA